MFGDCEHFMPVSYFCKRESEGFSVFPGIRATMNKYRGAFSARQDLNDQENESESGVLRSHGRLSHRLRLCRPGNGELIDCFSVLASYREGIAILHPRATV